MADVLERKCAKCKGTIEIERNNITDVIYFDKKYYHSSCFESMANQKAASKRGKPAMWQEALDNIWALEADTKKMLEHFWAKDDLNTWLLDHYDIVMVPSRFWQIIADLESGKYKGKNCKPIDIIQLCKMWIWGQRHLDKIALGNKSKLNGPTNDVDRLRYDLAILISHLADYKKHVAKVQAQEAERQLRQKETVKVDYSKIKTVNKTNGLDDISDLLDDII